MSNIRSEFLLIFIIVLVIVALPSPFDVRQTKGISVLDSEEMAFLSTINGNRSASTIAWDAMSQQWVTIAKGSLKPLSLSQSLIIASEYQSQDMASHNYLGHNSTDGRTPDERMYDMGYIHAYSTFLGENIAAGLSTANSVFNAWYVSTIHRAIMLCMQYNAMGIGRAYNASSNYGWYWTADFGGYDDSGQFDFSIGIDPTSASVIQGGSANANITVNVLNGIAQTVSLSTSISPAVPSISAGLSVTSGVPYFASRLTVSSTGGTPPGIYTITILGVSGALNRSASFELSITSPSASRVTFQASGLGGDATGTVLSVDGMKYIHSQLPMTFQWSPGSVHTYNWSSPISATSGKRYVWTATSGLVTSQFGLIMASANGGVTASYKTQYYLTVYSDHGSPTPASGWYDTGSITASVVTIAGDAGTGTRYRCAGYSGTGSVPPGTDNSVTFTLEAPSSITWNWIPQYYFTMQASTGGTVSPSSVWFDNGKQVTINATANAGYAFMNWTGTGLGSYSGTSETAMITISGPITEAANFQPKSQQLLGQLIAPSNGMDLTSSPVKLIAKVTYGESAVSGATVRFYVDGLDVGIASTNATGHATLSHSPSAGTHVWHTVVNWLVYNSAESDSWSFTYSPTKTLRVSVSAYRIKSTVRCHIKVTDGTTGKGVAGAAVKATLIRPNGMSTSTTKVTDSSGYIYTSYNINRRSPTGTYTVRADASASGYVQASGSTTFRI